MEKAPQRAPECGEFIVKKEELSEAMETIHTR